MIFDFYVQNAAAQNSESAKLREMTRMCALAFALDHLGHNVRVVSPPNVLTLSNRWKSFVHLLGIPRKGALTVYPAESLTGDHVADVAVKCSVTTSNDAKLVEKCAVYVAHECDFGVSNHKKTLNVPFLIHDRVIQDLTDEGLLVAYLRDELDSIRERFAVSKTRWVGFMGYAWPHRKRFAETAPDWFDFEFYETPTLGGLEHVKWLSRYRAGLALTGDTPKTNLPPLLAMLGIPIVAPRIEFNTPSLNESSYVPYRQDDKSLKLLIGDRERMNRIAEEATKVYKSGWSPIGQASLIVQALEG